VDPELKVGFIGTGNMGAAIAKAVLKSRKVLPQNVYVTDKVPSKTENITRDYPVITVNSAAEVIETAAVIFLCVKPQDMEKTVSSFSGISELKNKIFISIAAGITIQNLADFFKDPVPKLVRIMPNTPALINRAAGAISFAADITEEQKQDIMELTKETGTLFTVTEDKIDAVTAVSGSGPAFLYEYIIQMSKAARQAGLDEDIAVKLVEETVSGAVELLKSQNKNARTLRDMVTSPGGTTEAGLASLDKNHFAAIINDCIQAAAKRSVELKK